MHPARIARTMNAGPVQAGASLRGKEPERYGFAGLKERFSNPFIFQYYSVFYFFNRMGNGIEPVLKRVLKRPRFFKIIRRPP
jgi:hypothetical protein